MLPMAPQGPPQAKFTHPNGTHLRLQCFLTIRDAQGHVAALRLDSNPDAWYLPGEVLLLNEDPADAAARVAKTWFTTPLAPRLKDIFSYPATGPDDDRWYLLFVYEATLPTGATLAGTADTLEIRFVPPGTTFGPWAASHADVWGRLR